MNSLGTRAKTAGVGRRGPLGGLVSAARGVMTDKVFADKDADVDWDLVLGIREVGTLGKLQQAEANADSDAYDAVVTELEKHYATLRAFKVNKDDAKADVGNLGFLFELTQALFEVQTNALKEEEQSTKKLKDKTKAQRAEIKEQMDRIAEQDAEIEELQQLQLAAAATPGKGKGEGGETKSERSSPSATEDQGSDGEAPRCPLLRGEAWLDPSTTALLLIEFQNDFVHPEGKLFKAVESEMKRQNTLAQAQQLLAFCRERGALVVHAPITYCAEFEENARRYGVLYNVSTADAFNAAGWGANFLQEMAPRQRMGDEDDGHQNCTQRASPSLWGFLRWKCCGVRSDSAAEPVVAGKHGLDTFAGTDLDSILQKRGITNLAICGLLTNCCVESTMRTGYEFGYNVMTIIDCCIATSQAEHDASTGKTFPMFSSPMTSVQFQRALSGPRRETADPGPSSGASGSSPLGQRVDPSLRSLLSACCPGGNNSGRVHPRDSPSSVMPTDELDRLYLKPSSVMHARQRSEFRDLAEELSGDILFRGMATLVTVQLTLSILIEGTDLKGMRLAVVHPLLLGVFVAEVGLTALSGLLRIYCQMRANDRLQLAKSPRVSSAAGEEGGFKGGNSSTGPTRYARAKLSWLLRLLPKSWRQLNLLSANVRRRIQYLRRATAVMDMLKVALMASLMLGVEPSESGAWSHLSIDLILNVVFGVLDFAQHMQIFGEGGFG